MNNEKIGKIYNKILTYDADYHEIFYEEKISKKYNYIDSRLENIEINSYDGLSITLSKNNVKYFTSVNNFDNIDESLEILGKNFNKNNVSFIKLDIEESPSFKNNISYVISDNDKKSFFTKVNDFCRNYDDRIIQCNIIIIESRQKVKIANFDSIKCDIRNLFRYIIKITAKDNDKIYSSYSANGFTNSCDLNSNEWETFAKKTCDDVLVKFKSVPFKGGNIPVVINNGFGSVIFHEACGHAMESNSIVDNVSVLCNKIDKKIASDKVTIIDDGTINGAYGTTYFDDEGNKTKKNVLIKNGILKDYLTDVNDAKFLNKNHTSSGRKESFEFLNCSRMNNTYLDAGTDSIDDMIKSIDYGLYAVNLDGGSVMPNTGEFNFNVSLGYIIEKGKITDPVVNISLIGNSLDILSKVEMVSNNLKLDSGFCGSNSGMIPVTIGQPTVKVSSILVGGNNDN